jgi:hypothetical protein
MPVAEGFVTAGAVVLVLAVGVAGAAAGVLDVDGVVATGVLLHAPRNRVAATVAARSKRFLICI